ncbi:MAG: hypothetical protein JOY66_05080 [Acetobacteraceae bacterium]|nr:hypothetical protein [Acetobacteraceae bacterium]
MSDQPFNPPQVPLMPAEQARDVARGWKALAGQLANAGVLGEARYAERQSQWWLTYSIALAAKPPESA